MKKSDSIDDIKEAFSIFDKDGSGTLRVAEMKHVMSRIGDPLTLQAFEEFIECVQKS